MRPRAASPESDLDRRAFLRISGMTAATTCICCAPPARAQAAATAPAAGRAGYELRQIGDGLYWVSDGAYNTMFLVSSAGVIACDAPPTLGGSYLKAIAEVTDRPVTHLVYSHEHVDHIAGAAAFQSGVTIVAHRSTAELLARRHDPRRPMPGLVFDGPHVLEIGDQALHLAHHGVNHSLDTIFIHAPRQRVLMLVDVIYPGFMPYKNLGLAVDIPGFVDAHRQALAYDFQTLVAGHVSRPGTRSDVEVQHELMRDLATAADEAYATLSFPAFLASHPAAANGASKWALHNAYEQVLVDRMAAAVAPRWEGRLADVGTYLRDNCWAMLETFVVQGKPDFIAR